MPYDLEHHHVPTNGLTLHVVQCGPTAGPLVILLHGFPEFWFAWRQQMGALADAGYRVWAPDQRGYNLSDKPRRVREYSIEKLAGDIIGLIDAAGEEKAAIVGHDWGAAVAWHLALHHPERVLRTAVLNVPHPLVLGPGAAPKPAAAAQKLVHLLLSAAVFGPSFSLRFRKYRAARQSLVRSSRRGTFSEADLLEYIRAWSQAGGAARHDQLVPGGRAPPAPTDQSGSGTGAGTHYLGRKRCVSGSRSGPAKPEFLR